MKRKKRKSEKLALLIFAIVISTSLITGCKSNESNEMGKIGDVEIEKSEQDSGSTSNEKNIFTKVESPLEYSYNTLTLGRERIRMDIPTGWDIDRGNSRDIIITTPSNDKYMPGITIHFTFDLSHLEAGEDSAEVDNALYYGKMFQYELPYLDYKVNDETYRLRQWSMPEDVVTNYKFTDKEHESKVARTVQRADLKPINGGAAPNGWTYMVWYVEWDGIPGAISTIIPGDKYDNVESELRYIISSFTYYTPKIDATESCDLDGAVVKVPKGSKGNGSNALLYPTDGLTPYDGIGIGTYTVNLKSADTINSDTLSAGYGIKIAQALAPEKGYSYTCSASDLGRHTLGGKGVNVYNCIITMTADTNESAAGSYCGTPSIWLLDVFVYETENTAKAIAVMYQPTQLDALAIIEKMLITHTSW